MECVEWEGKAEQRDVVGCGTVEWNVLSGRVEHGREMLKYGRSEVILLESGNSLAVARPMWKSSGKSRYMQNEYVS